MTKSRPVARKRTKTKTVKRSSRATGRVPITRVPKPWGHETIWALTDRYVGKILHINAGHELSVQYHNKKDETIYLLSGQIVYRVQQAGTDALDDVQLRIGESFRITPRTIHQMVALTDCDVLEVSTPELDDVVRLSDKYGREGTSAP
jgi:mannose-6-phosphate isomerase-like protein (cupin superfamily)